MKLIQKMEKRLNEQGFVTTINSFNDKSATWIDIYSTEKQRQKEKSIGSICFNYKGTKVDSFSWHTKKEKVFRIQLIK
jgi:hypothetical protein